MIERRVKVRIKSKFEHVYDGCGGGWRGDLEKKITEIISIGNSDKKIIHAKMVKCAHESGRGK